MTAQMLFSWCPQEQSDYFPYSKAICAASYHFTQSQSHVGGTTKLQYWVDPI